MNAAIFFLNHYGGEIFGKLIHGQGCRFPQESFGFCQQGSHSQQGISPLNAFLGFGITGIFGSTDVQGFYPFIAFPFPRLAVEMLLPLGAKQGFFAAEFGVPEFPLMKGD
jgi:hypothetical protein